MRTAAREAPLEGLPLTEADAARAGEVAVAYPGVDGVELVVAASLTGVTRYASSQIIQNIVRREARVYVRAVVGDKTATATTNQLDREHLERAVTAAAEAARAARVDPEFPGLADPVEVGTPSALMRYDEATAEAAPQRRARIVADAVGAAGPHTASGVVETSSHVYAVFSSTGISCFDALTRCVVTALVEAGDRTGWAEASSSSVDGVDPGALARRATEKATRPGKPGNAAPGSYDVVLEEPAVALLVDYLGYAGFGAKQVIEGESFLARRRGSVVAAPAVTVADDAAHARSIGIGFDFEGVPKKRVAVIDAGVATGPVTDRRTARAMGVPLSGHGSGSAEVGPFAANIVLEPGTSTRDELVNGVDDGLLVTRFHYVNVLDRPATLLTGMTRDGTFRIRGGEIAEPVNNLRFTQGVLDALRDTTGIGRDLATFAPDWGSFGSTAAPAMRVSGFDFTSATTH